MNLKYIQLNFDSLMKKYGKGKELVLKDFKILKEEELKEKLTIKANAFSESAKRKIEKTGGEAVLINNKNSEKSKESKKKEEK